MTARRSKISSLAGSQRFLAVVSSILLSLLISDGVMAQQPDAAAPTATAETTSNNLSKQTLGPLLSRLLQNHARTILERQLKPEEFQVFVTATAAELNSESLPYLPATSSALPNADTPVQLLTYWLTKVDIEVLIAERFDQTTTQKIEEILIKGLALNKSRGDKITFNKLGIKVETVPSEIQRDLTRSEAETRSLKTQLDSLTRERDDAKRDLSQTKSQLDTMGREREDAKKELAQIKLELDRIARERGDLKVEMSKISTKLETTEKERQAAVAKETVKAKEKTFLQENAVGLISSGLFLVAIVIAYFAISGAARTLGNAVQTIGNSIPGLGDKIGESLAVKAPPPTQAAENPQRLGGATAQDRGAGESQGTSSLPLESVSRRVMELHGELSAVVTEQNEGIITEHLSSLLNDDASIGRAVATMELLGKDKANNLFTKLAKDHQQRVTDFLRFGVHTKPKGEVMIDAGEALKSRIFGADLPSRAKLNETVRSKLIQLKTEDIVSIAKALDGDGLARLFAYIEPNKLAPILTTLHKSDPNKFTKAAGLVGKIPEVENQTALDKDLISLITAQVDKADADIQAPYLNYYKSLLESVDDDVAESLQEKLASSSPRIERYLRESLVTLATFFRLQAELQEEIILGLSNKDIAALVVLLKQEWKDKVLSLVEGRRRDLVDEEVNRLTGKGQRQVKTAHTAAKQQVVARIKQMKGNGSIADMLDSKADGAKPVKPVGQAA